MNAKRGLWTLGLLTALALFGAGTGGCNNPEQQATPPKSAPTTSPTGEPATGPAAPATQPAVSALSPATQPAATQPSAAAAEVVKVVAPVPVEPPATQPGVKVIAETVTTLPAAPVAVAVATGQGGERKGPLTNGEPAPGSAARGSVAAGPANNDAPQTARFKGWYQWRGPEQNGVSREKNLPETWDPDTGENVVWTSDVGAMSSPVIWNGKLYTYSRTGEEPAGDPDYPTLAPGPKTQEVLVCVDIKDGKVLWKVPKNMTQTEVPFHRLGWSSPCVDPTTGRVYGLGSQATLECVDGETGKVIWDRQMTEEFGTISTFGGRTPAPTIDGDQLFLAGVSFGWGDHARSQHRLFAFDKNTGELLWSNGTGGIPVDAPQNTPVVAVVKGQRLVIFAAGDGGIHAFQARTGKKVWSFKASKRGINTSVVVEGERLYCSHGLDNYDTPQLGRVFCLDIGNVENGSPKEVWAIKGVEAAFPTPVVTEKFVFVLDDRANLHAVDKQSGKEAWKWDCGSVGKSSPVYGDGKLYVADGDGTFTILRPGDTRAATKALKKVRLAEKLGREYVIYGSPAICDGRVYLQTATKIYCIGNKDAKPEYDDIPPMPEEAAPQDKPAQLQVIPADVALHVGQSVKFTARAFDANGRFLRDVPANEVKWEIGQLTIPPPPPRPAMPKPENAPNLPATAPTASGASAAGSTTAPTATAKDIPAVKGPGSSPGGQTTTGIEGSAPKGESSDAARAQLVAAAASQPAAGEATQAGNLQGEVAPDGTFKSAGGQIQGGAVQASYADLKAEARVRVFTPLPWKFDFQNAPVGKPPLTWLGAGGKFAVVEDPDDKSNKVLQKLMDIDLYYRARTNFGTVDMSNYTVQSDAKVHEKVVAGRRYVPSAAVINSRYVLVMEGIGQVLQIHIWPSALPDERNPHGSQQKTIKFPFDAKKWYTLKLQVTQEGAKAVARGKCWPKGSEEPKDWMLVLEDPIPNRQGNPGLFAVSLVGDLKSEVYYDNIQVTPNGGATADEGGRQAATTTGNPSGTKDDASASPRDAALVQAFQSGKGTIGGPTTAPSASRDLNK